MIKTNPKQDELLTQFGKETMKRSYCQAHESYQDVFARVARHNQDNDEHGQFLYEIISKQFLMPSSPILSNSGTGAGMPISCFVNSTPDSMDGIRDTWMENVDLARNGGGVGTYWGNVRSIGEGIRGRGKSSGIIPFLKVQDSMTLGVNQGDQRRGSAATYLLASHPEVGEFLDMRRPSGGDPDRKCLNLHHGVVFTDEFMRAKEIKGAEYELKSPRDGSVRTKVDARSVWIRTLENRMFTGEPYMLFIDNVNRANPELYKVLGLRVETSNLCNEIMLHTGIDYLGKIRTAVCCLASLNFATYDQWKHMLDEVVEAALRMLDNVLTDFINRAKGIPGFANSAYAAERERSVGLGFMGLHTYLQSKGIAYESEEGLALSTEISRRVAEASDRVNAKLAQEKGACLDSQYAYEKFGTPLVRFAHTSAIAPTATISIIAGTVSPGAELIVANAYVQKTLSGTFINRNPNLERLLSSYGQNTEAVWSSITINSGSVQHLDFLSDHEKAVFRTAREVDQVWVIKYAGARQPYISQGQSVNIFVNADIHKKKLHEIHQLAWEMGLKGLYYLRAKAARKASLEATATNYGTWGALTEAQAIAIVDQQDKDDAVEEQKRLERLAAASGGEPSFDECLACQ